MIPHAATRISKFDLDLLERVSLLLEFLPDGLDLGKRSDGEPVELSCHILVRAIVENFHSTRLRCCDGSFLRGFDHSWIVTPDENILDVYPVGIVGGPFLVDGSAGILTRQLYTPMSEVDSDTHYSTMFTSDWFQNAVRTVVRRFGYGGQD